MKHINSILATLALMLGLSMATTPATAQTTDEGGSIFDTIIDTLDEIGNPDDGEEGEGEEGEEGEEVEGNFSRQIPPGLAKDLTEEEAAEYQAQLDAATTPQERNEIRRELHGVVKDRRTAKGETTEGVELESEKGKKEKKERKERKERKEKKERKSKGRNN